MWACDPAITSQILDSYHVAGPVFVQALQSFFAAQCAIAGDHIWPDDATDQVLSDPNYDFVVIGAGSAGSVVANRLSEIPDWKVLLVEAGGNPTLGTEIPQLFYSNMNTAEDWGYKNEPQDGACRGYRQKRCAWPRGKTLGGSSSINAMFYVRANKVDYDEWAALGNDGWSYDEVLPYFKKSENYMGYTTDDTDTYHGKEGPLSVENYPDMHFFEDLVIKAAGELGLKNSTDINGASQMGVIKSTSTTKDGVRHSTAKAFLCPIKDRQNLHIIKNAQATKILFKPGTNTVNGVVLKKGENEISVKINKELIVSGGSINSPQLLMLSGIGPRSHLESLGIEVKVDLPVGENLEDHLFVPIFYTAKDIENYTSLAAVFQVFVQYILEKKGPLSDTSPHRVIAFVNTTDPDAISPNMQHHYIVFPPGVYNLLDVLEKHDLSDEVQQKFRDMNKDAFTMIIYSTLLKPKSKGKIILKSTNPFDHPLIYANYFKEPEDMKTVLDGMKQHILKFGNTESFKKTGFKLNFLELEACKDYETESDDFLECLARELTFHCIIVSPNGYK